MASQNHFSSSDDSSPLNSSVTRLRKRVAAKEYGDRELEAAQYACLNLLEGDYDPEIKSGVIQFMEAVRVVRQESVR